MGCSNLGSMFQVKQFLRNHLLTFDLLGHWSQNYKIRFFSVSSFWTLSRILLISFFIFLMSQIDNWTLCDILWIIVVQVNFKSSILYKLEQYASIYNTNNLVKNHYINNFTTSFKQCHYISSWFFISITWYNKRVN